MKILLTGHKGFIGSNLARAWSHYDLHTAEWGDDWPDLADFDWVAHVGGISSTTEHDVEKIMRQNYDYSVELYEHCKRYGVNFQFSSSASVYGLGTNFKETAPVDPKTPYAWSKYLVERYIQTHPPTNNIRVQCLRYFNVYGPGEEHKGKQASPFTQFERQAKELGRIRVFDVESRRDFVHIKDLIDIQTSFLNSYASGIFNVGSGKTLSFKEIAEQYSVPIDVVPLPENLKSSYQTYTCADMSLTYTTLNYSGT
jgi:ADP-L-glycero-D-manno-heptose 6-epimerase